MLSNCVTVWTLVGVRPTKTCFKYGRHKYIAGQGAQPGLGDCFNRIIVCSIRLYWSFPVSMAQMFGYIYECMGEHMVHNKYTCMACDRCSFCGPYIYI